MRIHRGTKLVNPRVERDAVIASAVLYANDVLDGENEDAGEIASPVSIPCSVLTLSSTELADDDTPEQPGGIWWEPKVDQRRIALRPQPSDRALSVEIVTPSCQNCLEVKQVGEQGLWLQVERTGEGVTATGWIRRSTLKTTADGAGHGRGYGCTGDHHSNTGGVHRATKPLYEGPAEVHAGARVFADSPAGEWAIIKADLFTRVRHCEGMKWVELREIPGVDGAAWLIAQVPLESVSFPPVGSVH